MRFQISPNISRMYVRILVPALGAILASCGGGDGHTGPTGSSAPVNSPALYTLALRPLPSIYTTPTTKAINYSAYRAGGPGAGEVPSDANIRQDLTSLNSAGYTLLRLFDTDISHENILRVAAASFPTMKFHLGIYLQNIPTGNQATCVMPANDTDINNGIREANTYTNVVSVSIGNETSFSGGVPVHCLAGYITTVKQRIQQPVTADDDYTFYAGLSGASELPDTVLPLLDFVSIHMYPMSNQNFNWQQATVALTPLDPVTGASPRALAMMNAALVEAQANYTSVLNYMSSKGSTLPIVVGETGWKAKVTNPANALEFCCANPVNAKMYFDSMNTWQTGATGPKIVFYFEAFDEAWKLTDDGWGLWDATRAPRYALCGTTATSAPVCNGTLYSGAVP